MSEKKKLYSSLVTKVPVAQDKKTKQKEYLKHGSLAIVDQGQSLVGGYTNNNNMAVSCSLPVIVFGDHTRAVKYVPFPFGAGADGIKVLKPKDNISPKYLYYGTQYLAAIMPDRGYARHYQHLEKMKLSVPPIDEQERIVARIEELFSQLDSGVETLQKTKQQLAVYKRSAIAFALEPRGSACWTRTTVGDVCDCLDSMRRPVNRKTRALAVGKYPYYGANGETGRIDDYIFDEELVLVCEDETFVGRIKPFSYIINGKSWVNNHAHILRGKKGVLHNRFLNYVLSYYPFLPLVTGTTGRKKLTQSALLKAPITVCDYDTQAQIVAEIDARLTVCDSIERTVDTALQQAEAMRQSILKRAFEGEV